jgi:ribosomal protein S15P/S13E
MHLLNVILLVSAAALVWACVSIARHIKQHKKQESAEKAVRANP